MDTFLHTPVSFLKGLGPQRAEILGKELGIFTFGDLLMHFPFRYVDRSRIYSIGDLDVSQALVQIQGVIRWVKKEGKGRVQRLVARIEDPSGEADLVWFQGIHFMEEKVVPGKRFVVFGKPSLFKNILSFSHPELTEPDKAEKILGIQPVYPLTEKLKSKNIDHKLIGQWVLQVLEHPRFEAPEVIPQHILQAQALLGRKLAWQHIHFPSRPDLAEEARNRFKFEELFFLQLRIQRSRLLKATVPTPIRLEKVGPLFLDYYEHHLEYTLTGDQKTVLKEIRADLGKGFQMNRLLQGDVGSGKTLVAFLAMLMMVDAGYQSCLMAPTEILAQQHFLTLSQWASRIGLKVGLLTGSTPASERKVMAAEVESGQIQILTGTHALIEEKVTIPKLGLVVIDEQHRFGVQQRFRLWNKNEHPPHVLVMTATPIPRTLALTLYGDLEISSIRELPAGRKPIQTVHRYDHDMLTIYPFIREQVKTGRQAYIVYPLIEESEKLDLKNLVAGFDDAKIEFPETEFSIGMLHGKMKSQEKEAVMKGFVQGKTQVLVSTTVIEVGVNVPNATVMVIRNAERFGLSQLHQLRGRVGRGAEKSYCILVTGQKLGADSRKRMQTMVQSQDGFVIAEADLSLRGPGDIEGTRQSGMLDLKLTSLSEDKHWIELSRNCAVDVLKQDPMLELPLHRDLAAHLNEIRKKSGDWGRVG